jgi:hypothetical protein
MRAKRAALGVLLTCTCLLGSGWASAQEQSWLHDKRLGDGEGLRSGRFEFHPGVEARFGYDSNVFRRADTTQEPRVDALRLQITPAIRFQTVSIGDSGKKGRAPYELHGQASVSYNEFIKLKDTSDDLPGHRNLGALANLVLDIAPGAHWGGQLHAGLLRTIQPSNVGDPTASFNRTVPNGGGSLVWRPGGGLFNWGAGYKIQYTHFESDRFDELNNFQHDIFTKGSWKFLPRTSLNFDSRVRLYRYTSDAAPLPDGDAVITSLGVDGLVTDYFGFTVSGGWMGTINGSQGGATVQDFDTFIAQAEARFFLVPASYSNKDSKGGVPTKIALGYARTGSRSYLGNFYQRDRGYARLDYFFHRTLMMSIQGGASRVGFPTIFYQDGTVRHPSFSSLLIDGQAFVEYRPFPSFGINATVVYERMITDVRIPADQTQVLNDPNAVGDDLKWDRFQGFLGVRYFL